MVRTCWVVIPLGVWLPIKLLEGYALRVKRLLCSCFLTLLTLPDPSASDRGRKSFEIRFDVSCPVGLPLAVSFNSWRDTLGVRWATIC